MGGNGSKELSVGRGAFSLKKGDDLGVLAFGGEIECARIIPGGRFHVHSRVRVRTGFEQKAHHVHVVLGHGVMQTTFKVVFVTYYL